MDAFLLYILKSGICLTVFYVCFKALFSNDTFFRFNRWILLVGTGVACCCHFAGSKQPGLFLLAGQSANWR